MPEKKVPWRNRNLEVLLTVLALMDSAGSTGLCFKMGEAPNGN